MLLGEIKPTKNYENVKKINEKYLYIPYVNKVSKFESNAITLTSMFGKKKKDSGQFDPNTTRGLI